MGLKIRKSKHHNTVLLITDNQLPNLEERYCCCTVYLYIHRVIAELNKFRSQVGNWGLYFQCFGGWVGFHVLNLTSGEKKNLWFQWFPHSRI